MVRTTVFQNIMNRFRAVCRRTERKILGLKVESNCSPSDEITIAEYMHCRGEHCHITHVSEEIDHADLVGPSLRLPVIGAHNDLLRQYADGTTKLSGPQH